MTPFDYINSINNKNIIEELEDYNRYVIDIGLSYFVDTILFVNEINQFPKMENQMHYDFLYNSIPKKKRFSKWNKKENDDDIDLIKEVYSVNSIKGKQYKKILTEEQLKYLRNMKGGKNGN
jgi:hypothetical protein